MLTLINTNRMSPPIGPIGLDYVAGYLRSAGHEVDVVDLCLCDDPAAVLRAYFCAHDPELVGLTFRNTDDCFWPSAEWFVPNMLEFVRDLRGLTDAPMVMGGVGFSIYAERLVEHTGVDFGIRGDGEHAMAALVAELAGGRRFERVGGLVWRDGKAVIGNPPAWPRALSLPVARDAIDNAAYFRRGGAGGVGDQARLPAPLCLLRRVAGEGPHGADTRPVRGG